MLEGLSKTQFGSQAMGVNTSLSGMSPAAKVTPNIGKTVGSIDFSQAQPAMRQTMSSFRAAQSAPNIGGVNKNIGSIVRHPSGGQIDFSQAKMANRTPRPRS